MQYNMLSKDKARGWPWEKAQLFHSWQNEGKGLNNSVMVPSRRKGSRVITWWTALAAAKTPAVLPVAMTTPILLTAEQGPSEIQEVV